MKGRKVTFENYGKIVPSYLHDQAIHHLNIEHDGKLYYSTSNGFFYD